jgi:O-antigen/teichoic acid export membrane protein
LASPSPSSPAAAPDQHRDFINKGSRFMLLDNVSKVLEPLLILVCARVYAGGDWGYFKYYESLILLLVRFASLGLDRGVVWIYSRCRDDEQFVARFSRAANLVFLLSGAACLFVILQRLHYLPDPGSWTKKLPAAPLIQILLFLATVPVQALTLLFTQSFINKKVLYYGLLVKNLAIPAAIYGPALFLAFTPWKSMGLALPYLVGNLLGLILAARGFARFFGASWKQWAFSASASRALLRFSLPLASTDFFMSFAYRIDFLLLGSYSGIREVEIYSVIVMISNTLRSLRQSMDGIMLSVFSHDTGGVITAHQKRSFNYASWVVLTLQLPFLYLSLFFGRELLSLIAPQYGAGYRVLAIATFFHLFTTLGAFSGQLLVGIGKTYMIPVSQVAFFLASLGLNFLLVPRYGAEGAALAIGLSLTVGGGVSFFAIWAFAKSPILDGECLLPLAVDMLILAPAVAIHFLLRPPLLLDAAIFLAGLAPYAWHARRQWKRFNAEPR